MKPVAAFYDVHPIDQAAYQAGLAENYELVFCDDGFSSETVALASEAAILSVHVTSTVSAELMAKLPKLRHVACRSTGYDNVDLAYARAHHIAVTNVPAYGQDTVAEYAFLLMLAVARRLLPATGAVHAGEVVPEKLTGHELAGKTLGIIGAGRIGQQAATIGRGFGMEVVAYDAQPREEVAARLGFTYAGLNELLSRADYLTLHAPATPETHHLLGAPQFARMKRGVFIVNTARGSLIDTPALIQALESGQVAGAGLDVLEGEEYLQLAPELHLLGAHKLAAEARQVLGIDILLKLPNVVVTSHNAYNSAEALARIRQITIQNIVAWQSQKTENEVTL
jgi:D-lactate dehydrogenase